MTVIKEQYCTGIHKRGSTKPINGRSLESSALMEDKQHVNCRLALKTKIESAATPERNSISDGLSCEKRYGIASAEILLLLHLIWLKSRSFGERPCIVSILSLPMCKNIKKHESLCETWYSTIDSCGCRHAAHNLYQSRFVRTSLVKRCLWCVRTKRLRSHLGRPFNAFPDFLPKSNFLFLLGAPRAKDYAQALCC